MCQSVSEKQPKGHRSSKPGDASQVGDVRMRSWVLRGSPHVLWALGLMSPCSWDLFQASEWRILGMGPGHFPC